MRHFWETKTLSSAFEMRNGIIIWIYGIILLEIIIYIAILKRIIIKQLTICDFKSYAGQTVRNAGK